MSASARKADEDGKREELIRIRVNQGEKEEIEKFTKAYGCATVSEYVRQTALGYRNADRELLKKQ